MRLITMLLWAGHFSAAVLLGQQGGAFSNTPEGKIVTAAFADSLNQMVKALTNYKVQQVKGGLGKTGSLKVGQQSDKAV